jgi:hypothetical protein
MIAGVRSGWIGNSIGSLYCLTGKIEKNAASGTHHRRA